MKHLIFLLSSLFLTFSSHAQPIDTLIFDSDFERKVFLHYADSQKINPLDLFISVGYDRDYTQISGQIDQFKNTLISKGVIHAKTKKQLKEIYKSVHDKFFKKYEADSYFGDIFSSGTYNCVTASALYALILKDFRIDFIIKEKPDHVYLIADPYQNSFLIEPTLPTKGLYFFDEKTKREYLEYLHDNKIISDDEFRQQSFDKLFAKYFLSDKDIDLIQLAGLQYYNKGFFIYTSGNYEGALRYFEKAEILYPSNTIKFMKDNALANVLNGQNSEKKYQGKTLAKYLNANKNNAIAIQSGTDIFKFVSSELVMNHPDMKAYELYFDEFIKWLNDSIEINDIYQTYHSMNAYYYTLAFAYDKALYHLNEAYAVNPENINIKQSIIEILARSFMGETNMEPHIDSINYYCVKYPFVGENKVILEFLTYGYAKVAGTSFQYANGQKGNEYLTKLELFINRHPETEVNKEYVDFAYSQAAVYHVRNQQYNTAIGKLNKGLQLAPNSAVLKEQMENIRIYVDGVYRYVQRVDISSDISNNQKTTVSVSNKSLIHQNINKYLIKSWKSMVYFDGQKTISIPQEEQVILTFYADHKVKFKDSTSEEQGTWRYEPDTYTLFLENAREENFTIKIEILEMDENVLKAFMYTDNEEDMVKVLFMGYGN